jgi:hypothetical protein
VALETPGQLNSSFSRTPLAVHYPPQRAKELTFISPGAVVHNLNLNGVASCQSTLYSSLRERIAIAILLSCGLGSSAAGQSSLTSYDLEAGRQMLQRIRLDVEKYYYNPSFHVSTSRNDSARPMGESRMQNQTAQPLTSRTRMAIGLFSNGCQIHLN